MVQGVIFNAIGRRTLKLSHAISAALNIITRINNSGIICGSHDPWNSGGPIVKTYPLVGIDGSCKSTPNEFAC
jgi:hypothetical protein